MLLRDFIASARRDLSGLYPEDEACSIVSVLCCELLGVKDYTHIIEPGYIIPDDKFGRLSASLERLKDSEPLQYVLGYADFYGFRFRVTPDVLIPRPETELLCDEAISWMSGIDRPSVLDLCTGSGCIAWTLALSVKGSEVVAVDISDAALSVASGQDFPDCGDVVKPEFVRYDVLEGADGFISPLTGNGEFDVIVSNPPYVRISEKELMHHNVLDYEPGLALFVPDEDPLVFYRAVCDFALKRLRNGGFGIVEINEAFGDATAEIFSSAGFSSVEILKDFGAKNRLVRFRK